MFAESLFSNKAIRLLTNSHPHPHTQKKAGEGEKVLHYLSLPAPFFSPASHLSVFLNKENKTSKA